MATQFAEVMALRVQLKEVRARVADLEAANERKAAALRQARPYVAWQTDHGVAQKTDDLAVVDAALSDAGEGWLSPEVREQVREALALFRRWNRGNEKGIKYEDMAMALLEAESALEVK